MKTRIDVSKRASILLKCILWLLLLFVVINAAIFAYEYGRAIFMDEAMTQVGVNDDVEVFILEDADAKRVAEQLEDAGVIEDENLFYIQAVLSDMDENIKGGTYVLNSSMKPSKILDLLQTGVEE